MAFWKRKKSEEAPEDRFTVETLRDVLSMLAEDSEDDWIEHQAFFDSDGAFITSRIVDVYEITEESIKVNEVTWKSFTKT